MAYTAPIAIGERRLSVRGDGSGVAIALATAMNDTTHPISETPEWGDT